jgi:HK97 family phage portal protein
MNPITRAFKAVQMSFSARTTAWFSMFVGRTRFDYRAEVGDGSRNSIVAACVLWICRTFPEAPIRVCAINADGEDTPLQNHPLKMLLDTPNPYYPGELLWSATLADRTISGNAYWIKIRSAAGRVVELWWVPSTLIEPQWPDDGSQFISHYKYTPGSEPLRLETRDVVHFRYQTFDPHNIRKGLSPIQTLVREIFTDDEAANYTAAMLRNVGVPPVIISPSNDASPTQAELEQTKTRYQDITTGDNRGQALVMSGPTNVSTLGFNPQQMDTRNSRRVPEERVSAVLGIHAAVVGLGTGLENTKVGATMSEMREQAYESNIIPTQRLMAAEIRSQLLPDFGDVRRLKVDFDLSEVRVLQVDQNALWARTLAALNGGAITLNMWRQEVGMEPVPEGDVYYIPGTVTPTNTDELIPVPEPAPTMLPTAADQPALPAAVPKRLPLVVHRQEPLPSMLGQPLNLTDEELRQLAEIHVEDVEAARELWREEAPDDLADLLDAREATG